MAIELNPEVEKVIQERAAREGTTPNELLARILGEPMPKSLDTPKRFTSDDEKRARVLAYIHASPEEIARLHAPHIARLEAQLKEAENATPEEIAEAEAEWDAHKKAMNDNRRITGERLLYPEEPS